MENEKDKDFQLLWLLIIFLIYFFYNYLIWNHLVIGTVY